MSAGSSGSNDPCPARSETADSGDDGSQAEGSISKRPRLAAGTLHDEYFQTYNQLSVHTLMLGDAPRVGAYAAALKAHRPTIEGKVVLDVGAGSGILSLLAAKHGLAARVYAVEATPAMANLARQLVAHNGLGDVVQVVEGLAEDVSLPEKVDVIVSEWMGFYLIHESMLESVLVARDRWLRPGGLMLPGRARIWASPVEAEELRCEIEAYKSMHGLDLEPVGTAELERRCAEPQVESVDAGRLLAAPKMIADFGDLHTLAASATTKLEVDVQFLTLRAGCAAGVAFWFDVGFASREQSAGPGACEELVLCTSPGAPATHWKQTVVYLGAFPPVEAGDRLEARIIFAQSQENPRQYDITVET